MSSLVAVLNGHFETTERISVALWTHHAHGKSDNIISGAIGSDTASAKAGRIECNVTCAWAAFGALAIGAATAATRAATAAA